MASKKMLQVTQIASTIRRQKIQGLWLKSLGLGKLHRTRVLEDTPSIRGLLFKAKHLVAVKEL